MTSVGVADPAQNSVGVYAVESLKKLGVYDKLDKAKRIRSNWHALTVVEWVCQGKIDAGIYYDNCPFTSGPTKLEGNTGNYHIVGEMPADSYSRIQVQAGRLLEGPNEAGAGKFITWLMSAEGQKLLNDKGVPSYDAAPSQGGKTG
ncbi:MAG: substrate-binding domain-containing protein [Armatimonadetes bacterium]|nr:substrate-binding domain-containing protein [Armatimonadota bacterium]